MLKAQLAAGEALTKNPLDVDNVGKAQLLAEQAHAYGCAIDALETIADAESSDIPLETVNITI